MAAEDQAAKAQKRAARKRKAQTIACVVWLLSVLVLYVFFIRAVSVGYLTWIGVTTGMAFLTPLSFVPIALLARKETLAKHLVGVWGCLAILILLIQLALAFWPRGPGPWRPYSFEPATTPIEVDRAVPDEENAALRYDIALAFVNPHDRPGFIFAGSNLRHEFARHPWKREDHPQASDWLDAHAAVLAELLQIARMEQCRWPVRANYISKSPVPHDKLRRGAHLLTLAGNQHAGEGRFEEALQAYFALLRQADHLHQQTCRIDLYHAFSSEEPALHMIRYLLAHSALSPGDMSRIARHLRESPRSWQRDTQRLVDFQEYRFVHHLARAYEINEQGKTRFTRSMHIPRKGDPNDRESTWTERLWPLHYCLTMPLDPQDLWPLARDESSEVRHFLAMGPLLPEHRRELEASGIFSAPVTRRRTNPLRFGARFLYFDWVSYPSFGQRYAEYLARRRGTWLVLGLSLYRAEHGVWPPSLDQISEHVPTEASIDPTSRGSFVYSVDGDTFKLYSKGLNRIDEGGRNDWNETRDTYEDDIAIWPPHVRKPRPQSKEDMDLMMKQLREIYGERYPEMFRDQDDPKDNQ